MPIPELRVSHEAPATLAMAGALVFDNAAEALRHARGLLCKDHHDCLDLGGVTAVDSAGLACVVAVMAAARRKGDTLSVARIPDSLAALARVCEVDALSGSAG